MNILSNLNTEKRCLRCNRILKDDESVKRGYGPNCWKKLNNDRFNRHKKLFEVKVNEK